MPFTSADTEVGLILTPDRTQRSCINAASMAGLAALSRDLWVAGAVVWSGFALGKEAAQNLYFGSLLTSFSFVPGTVPARATYRASCGLYGECVFRRNYTHDRMKQQNGAQPDLKVGNCALTDKLSVLHSPRPGRVRCAAVAGTFRG